MATLSTDAALSLLGGPQPAQPAPRNGHDLHANGHDLMAGRANSRGTILITQPRHFWPRLFGGHDREPAIDRREPGEEKLPGGRLIGTGAALLMLLGTGLLLVSFAAQYSYVLSERHQNLASLIEAGALDVGMLIFSLIALGLARRGVPSKVERTLILICAAGSAAMNYAAADVTSPRSVLAYCMPPVFLAVVVDRVVSAVRRHVLGMRDGRSPWAALGTALALLLQFLGLTVLYLIRIPLAPSSTFKGLRRAILAATPLPEADDDTAQRATTTAPVSAAAAAMAGPLPRQRTPRALPAGRRRGEGTKTARLLKLTEERHGALGGIPLAEVSKIATDLAPEVGIHPASARTALLRAVRAALPAGKEDVK